MKGQPKIIEIELTESEALRLSNDLLPYNLLPGEYLQFAKNGAVIRLRVLSKK